MIIRSNTTTVNLLADACHFHGAHRAIDDCYAALELLARPLTVTSTTAFETLVDRALRKILRIWAERASFDLKNQLKKRGDRSNDGSDGRPKSWHIDVIEGKRDAELDYLKKEIYQRDVSIAYREITALDRFFNRV